MMTNTLTLNQGAKSLLVQLLKIIGGSLFLCLCSQIQIPLWFTPVPITLQTFAVMVIAGTLGSRLGTLSVLLYLAEVSAGLPVCAGGVINPLALIGPSGGYFLGMVLQAFLTGLVFESNKITRTWATFTLTFLISLVQLAMGALWLGSFVGFQNAIMMGFTPFLIGDALKVLIATLANEQYRNLRR